MSEHYFSKQTEAGSDEWTFPVKLAGHSLHMTTDHAVFSKREVDFGSRLLIETFREPDVAGDLLDLGCGYGPIGIAIAKRSPDRKVVMVDVNERALQLAERNARDNAVSNVEILESDRFKQLEGRSFAAILTNPPIRAGKAVVHNMFSESYEALRSQGELWVVIQKKQGAPSAKQKLEELFGEVHVMTRKKGYYVLKMKKD
ncbi:class I SAM-dependent methyltransferase [Thalassobacillus sp. CUG 92003]|uniref:class I SAM-dependent methyltransferase n=1 Tax=Thalassobacillus sp. CUG 92003 TaxID=2736641 RepID=UPI0015E77AB6|nr:class I SAM-dependent methyltransferase [Thalassobacillus sp. CUG 92003]